MRTTFVIATLAALATGLPAHAGRPLQTEDAGVLERGSCEIEGVAQRLDAGGVRSSGRSLGLGCGWGWPGQLGLAVERASSGGERETAFSLGGKAALLQPADGSPALTLAWGATATREGSRWRHTDTSVLLVASASAPGGQVHLNAGTSFEREPRRRVASWGLAYEHEGFAAAGLHWAPMAELFGDDREGAWANAALRVTLLPDRLFVDLSIGRQQSRDKARLVTAGFKLAF